MHAKTRTHTSPAFGPARQAAARAGRELLLPTDVRPDRLAELAAHPAIGALVDALGDCGASLRLLPASYAPWKADRSRVSAWMDPSEADVVHLGVTADATVTAVVRAGARLLALVEGHQPADSGDAEIDRVRAAVVEARAWQLTSAADAAAPIRGLRTLTAKYVQRRDAGTLAEAAALDAAAQAWAALAVIEDEHSRMRLLEMLTKNAPELGRRVGELLSLCPQPTTAEQLEAALADMGR